MTANETAQQLQSIQQLVASEQFAPALEQLKSLLDEDVDQPDALYMAAVCYRYLRQWQSAQSYLDHLLQLAPEHGRGHQERGHLFRAQQMPGAALRSYQRACQINPALEASWRGQLEMALQMNDEVQANQARHQLQRLQALPKPLVAVTDLLAQRKLVKAENLCRQFLQQAPRHVEAMRLLSDIGVRLGAMDDAEFLLESAVLFEPDNQQVRIDYVQVLRKRQKFTDALSQAKLLLDSNQDNPQFQSLYAIELMQTGDYTGALVYFDKVLARLPGDAVTLTSRGHALKTSGQQEEAVESYRMALNGHPDHGEAYYSLANLKTYRFTAAEVNRMRQQEGSVSANQMSQVYLMFALGKAHEDLGEYSTAFDYYRQGNDLKRAQSGYDAQKMGVELQAQAAFFSADVFKSRQHSGDPAADPIFIVGLPRAGSTLLEQILASHSLVDGTLELPNILSIAQSLRRRGQEEGNAEYPTIIADMSALELRELGEKYLAETAIHRQGAPYFIDKMPNNFRHVGLIKLILPNAKIIDARRHPMACCFSGYKQLFAEGQEFSYDLDDLGSYYRDYVQLMDHWQAVLPGDILQVNYEQVVADLDGQVRRLLDYCGLPFEPQALEFHDTERSVRTASSEQVRQPLYRDGLDQWRNFETELQPLEAQLGEVIQRHEKSLA
ncbi:MAG: sulfotransferase [Halioglobus sp.]|nr:sulfotransferase [Halioglobus sp.]